MKSEASRFKPAPATRLALWVVAPLIALLAGCAALAPAPAGTAATSTAAAPAGAPTRDAAAPGASGSSPTAAAARPAPTPGAPPPFAEVTRDAKRADGYLPLWTREDRTWLEIPAALLDKPFFFASSRASGLGERFFYPGLMGRSHMVVLRRVGNTVQLLAINLHARAPAGTPLASAVAESYSDSLLASAPLAAAPHAQSKALLVDAFALLGGDIGGLQTVLESSYRLPYALDRAHSHIERTRAEAGGTYLTVRQHFSVAKLPAPPVPAPGAPPPNPAAQPNPPQVVPDPRSLFISQAYTLAPLPATPMATRRADQRVGYFTQPFINFGDDNAEGRRTHLVRRWRLEKKDPAAAVSEPKEPIRVVMDRNIPLKWREPLRAGALEWNKAFERAGFRNAITVEQQPADAGWSSFEGTRMLALRWFAQDGPGTTAVGPSQSDPRTGEMLRGAAIIDENRVRVSRARAGEMVPRLNDSFGAADPFASSPGECSNAEESMEQARFGFELLVARGQLDPFGADAERYIAAALKDVTMHEIGHALGLRHNFRASTAVTPAQLRDREFTSRHGTSSSVMDYNGQNTPLDGEAVADYNMVTLGAYDYWAIEFGYREFANADAEKQGLAELAARSATDPALAYATDEDLGNADPLVNQRDMGNDPLAFAQRQIVLGRELWQRIAAAPLDAQDDMTIYRRTLQRLFASLGAALPMATKYVGGTYVSRKAAGAGQPLTVPVPAAQQRAALQVVTAEAFASASFKFDPRLMSRLAVDPFERNGPNRSAGVDFSLPGAVLGLQRGALDTLMSESLASRLADAEAKVADPAALLSYAEVQDHLGRAIWSELAPASGAADIDSLRRNLQREHLRRLAGGLLRPASMAAADVRAAYRQTALQLQAQLSAALAGRRWSAPARAHLDDSLATLSEALKAPLVKQGV